MQLHKMKARKCDARGCGHFGASRGDRQHNGVDLACMIASGDSDITFGIDGQGVRNGYPFTWASSDRILCVFEYEVK